ncbi:hypothetical protein TCAL_16832 [Tigriopus californicus]|uniref:Glutaredoxin domain-containing protein n=1 Tax=Tigriopus californicus TaxID=6832 RepID=A0A553PC74_TIGCA|nr:hypothetical protein TCAL_16832 [Tigriopus californicus]
MSKGKDLAKTLMETKKRVLDKYSIPAENIEILQIENRPDMDEIQDFMKSVTGGRSVPRVFIGGKCIGGGDETQTLDKQGKLKPMLEAVGAL